MKSLICILLNLLVIHLLIAQSVQTPCLTDIEYQRLLNEHPSFYSEEIEIEAFTEKWIKKNNNSAQKNIITIPVVVHLVLAADAEYISDNQIHAQIENLNKDFRKGNSDISKIPEEFKHLAADIEIEFCLATVVPENESVDIGITRTQADIPDIAFRKEEETPQRRIVKHDDLGGKSAWPTDQYLNIWVAETEDNNLLGDATYPGRSLIGEDGVVIDVEAFGTNGTGASNLGRTLTHEVGHYLNLKHIWGDKDECTEDDCVVDTPTQDSVYYGCPDYPVSTCGSTDMTMNYMGYVDDACMYMFTIGQKWRMLAALNGPRSSLLSSNGCANPGPAISSIVENIYTVFPNPANTVLNVNMNGISSLNQIDLLDRSGRLVNGCSTSGTGTLHTLDLTNVLAGLYIVRIRKEGVEYFEKVVVVK